MLTTGMSIVGKISVGVRTIASPPMIRMRIDITTNVYGRRNASRTIHIEVSLWSLYDQKARYCPIDRQATYSIIFSGMSRPGGWADLQKILINRPAVDTKT